VEDAEDGEDASCDTSELLGRVVKPVFGVVVVNRRRSRLDLRKGRIDLGPGSHVNGLNLMKCVT
jgi:hypothetical protein